MLLLYLFMEGWLLFWGQVDHNIVLDFESCSTYLSVTGPWGWGIALFSSYVLQVSICKVSPESDGCLSMMSDEKLQTFLFLLMM